MERTAPRLDSTPRVATMLAMLSKRALGRRRSSCSRSAKNFAHDCLPFLKKEFYGEIPNLISKRSDGRTRWRMGGGWSRRTRFIHPLLGLR
jgi:hypothetical protein